jgi:ubiquitin carboxyl-terminal hydrolase 1
MSGEQPPKPSIPLAYTYPGDPAARSYAWEDWFDANTSISIVAFTIAVVIIVSQLTGRHLGLELLFFVKRILLHAKDMAYRFSSGLIKPSMIAHAGNGQAGGTAVGNMLARTGLSNLANRMAEKKPIGLGNFDFSCYQNSIVQGLASLVSLPKFLDTIASGEDNSAAPTSTILRTTIQTLNAPQDRRMIMLPKVLKSMSSIEQQDAQEYYSKVLDQLDKEMTAREKASSQKSGLETAIESKDSAATEQSEDGKIQNPLEGLIAQRVGCLQCGHSDGISLIPFNNLTLPLSPYSACHISESLDEYAKLEIIEGVECPKCTLLQSETKLLKMKSKPLPDIVLANVERRLSAIRNALAKDDYSDKTLAEKCELPKKLWVSTTKSKQTVIGQPPQCLVVHFNRSVFDETTGDLYKNHSNVRFPAALDLGPWCVKDIDIEQATKENNSTGHKRLPSAISDPRYSMLPPRGNYPSQRQRPSDWQYELRAAVIHYGRHENGHYICYRKYPQAPESEGSSNSQPGFSGWWELSDDDVQKVAEIEVLQQGQVFMLFYELVVASMGEEEALLRIACGTPLPAEVDLGLDQQDGIVLDSGAEPDHLDMSSSMSSEEELSIPVKSHDRTPSASLPKMSTGLHAADDTDRSFDQAGRTVNVV